jgi:hypothetical protein
VRATYKLPLTAYGLLQKGGGRSVRGRGRFRPVSNVASVNVVWRLTARPRVERWVEVRVQEAYIHCRKHLPHLVKVVNGERAWGTDDARAKGGDYFGSACEPRPWVVDS